MSLSSGLVDSDVLVADEPQQVEVEVEGLLQQSDALKAEPSTTPPSSPPVLQESMASQSQDMPPPGTPASKTRKRSRGESADLAINVPDSSASAIDDVDSLASQQDKEQDSTTNSAPTIMQNQRLARSSQSAPTSAQSAELAHRQHAATRPGKPPKTAAPPPKKAQQEARSHEREPESDVATVSHEPGLPEDPIEFCDWSELEHRYHLKCSELRNQELEIFSDLTQLVSFFEVWAEVGGRKESDRGFKRLKTQMAYVQHEEDEVEKKRLHYVRVVDAFKTVDFMMEEPNRAQSFIPDQKSLSKVRRSISRQSNGEKARPEKRKRDPRTTPLINAEDWAVRVAGDVDMERFSCRNPHAARCIIL